jgi:hypothetical protein
MINHMVVVTEKLAKSSPEHGVGNLPAAGARQVSRRAAKRRRDQLYRSASQRAGRRCKRSSIMRCSKASCREKIDADDPFEKTTRGLES